MNVRVKRAFFMVLGVALAGCAWIGEERQYHMQKEWEEFQQFNWRRAAGEASGADVLFPSPRAKKMAAEREVCLHENGENRVISENGVSDRVGYRRCVLAPYPMGAQAPGGRLKNRPEPQS